MRLRRPTTIVLGAAISLIAAVTACSTDNGGESTSGEITVSFWHGLPGDIGQQLDAVIDDFNEEHEGEIRVVSTFQGDYDEGIAKLKASFQSGNPPTMAQVYEIGTRVIFDSQQARPIQEFVDDDDQFDLSSMQKAYLDYFTVDGKLQSMPLNGSSPVLYYNKDAFAEAGLDPERPPSNLDEIREFSEKIVASAESDVDYGFGAALYAWFLEQFAATSGELYCDEGNGRQGLATRVELDAPSLVSVTEWWTSMVEDGLAVNTGRVTTDAQNAFMAGNTAITLDSAGLLGSFVRGAKFEVGTGAFPGTSATVGSPVIGGASMWIFNEASEREQEAAWTFVKYMVSAEAQATFSAGTGYIPVTEGALDEPVFKEFLTENPAFETGITQVASAEPDLASQGCLLGAMPQVRQEATKALEAAVLGQMTVVDAMAQGVAEAGKAVETYNQSVSR